MDKGTGKCIRKLPFFCNMEKHYLHFKVLKQAYLLLEVLDVILKCSSDSVNK